MSGIIASSMNSSWTIISLVVTVLAIVELWMVFVKAGKKGWAAIIPFYNLYILCKVAGRPGWWLVLYFIPFVFFIPLIIIPIDLAKRFGTGTLFGVLMIFFNLIFLGILAFGSATYQEIEAV